MVIENSNIKLIEQNSYSSLFNRSLAALVDGMIMWPVHCIIVLVIGFILNKNEQEELIITNILFITLWTIYEVYCLTSKMQATVGQNYCRIRFSTTVGKKITLSRALYRTLLPVIYTYIFLIIMGLLFGSEIMTFSTMTIGQIIIVVIQILPYFFTKKKQLLYDWLTNVVALQELSKEVQ